MNTANGGMPRDAITTGTKKRKVPKNFPLYVDKACRLTLAELESTACTLAAVFLTFFHTWVTC